MLSMAGKSVELLVSPTLDRHKSMVALNAVTMKGNINFIVSLQISMLALNHRMNKNGGQRIIVFVGSPLIDQPADLLKLANLMKKNNVAIDVIMMGEGESNTDILNEFVTQVSNNENSSLSVLRGGNENAKDEIAANVAFSLRQTGGGGGNAEAGGAFGDTGGAGAGTDGANNFGVNDNEDPELAMVLRISAEEERAASEEQARKVMAESASAGTSANANANTSATAIGGDDDEIDEELLAAMALSMQQGDQRAAGDGAETGGNHIDEREFVEGGGDSEDENEDEDMAAALALSMQAENVMPPQPPATAETAGADTGTVDTDFIREMLGVDGMDPDDPLIAAALAQLGLTDPNTNTNTNGDKKGEDKKRKDQDPQ